MSKRAFLPATPRGFHQSESDSVQHRARPALVATVGRSTGKILVDLTGARNCGDVTPRERPRYRRGLRPIASPNQARVAESKFVNRGNFFAHPAKLAFSPIMSDFEGEREGIWDEYDWERFLQQQDQRTEKYMELLENYIDDPQRDEIIAREMGWTQILGDGDWSAEVDALLDEDWRLQDQETSDSAEQQLSETFEDHILYRAAFALTVWIDKLFDQNASLQNEPAAIKLATHAALASAKLAAALSDDDVDELGMTIAYLKRALKAITVSLDSASKLLSEKLIGGRQYSVLQQRLFQVRDGIITLMGEYRGEWRRRFGSEGFRG